jgi:hypothetical protein
MTKGEAVLALLTAASVVVAVASVVVAVLALGHARRATEAASGAVIEAKDANTISKAANKISTESNAIAEQAARDAREAPTAVAWDELMVALAPLQSFDPASSKEPFGPLLTNLRARVTLLVDRVPWGHFDKWVAAEQIAGVNLMREASERGHAEKVRLGRDLTPDEALQVDERFHLWVVSYSTNLRMCRRTGPTGIPFQTLTEAAWKTADDTAARNGWPRPPRKIKGLEPLGPGAP